MKRWQSLGRRKERKYILYLNLRAAFTGMIIVDNSPEQWLKGKSHPFGCRQNPLLVYKTSGITGAELPVYRYARQPSVVSGRVVNRSPKALKEEIRRLL